MKYVWCKLKNIGIIPRKNKDYPEKDLPPHLAYVEHLPNDCIRLKSVKGYCESVCFECIEDLNEPV